VNGWSGFCADAVFYKTTLVKHQVSAIAVKNTELGNSGQTGDNEAMKRQISHVIGIDDAPFEPAHRGDVLIVGAVYGGHRLEGVVNSRVRRDGVNSTRRIAEMVKGSRFAAHLQLVMLQGIAFAGFNVVDIHYLNRLLDLPVLVVMRRRPDFQAIREALTERVVGGLRKWRLIESAGEVEPLDSLFVQRVGIELDQAEAVVRQLAISGNLPEPLRTAHLIAGGMSPLETHHRA
jgi:uncharacterized protein